MTDAVTPIELAVLDLAGTTVADPGLVENAVRHAAGSLFDDDSFIKYRGASKRRILASMVGEAAADDALMAFNAHIVAVVESGAIEALPHADEALRRMAASGITVCLNTGFAEAIRKAIVDQLAWDEVAAITLSPGPACRGRPWPDLVLTAALRAGVTSMASVAVVGDTTNDVITAQRAGAGIAAAVLTGAHDRATLAEVEPTHIFDHVGEFADLVIG